MLEILGDRHELVLPLAGQFQAMNALAALGLVIATGGPAIRCNSRLSPICRVFLAGSNSLQGTAADQSSSITLIPRMRLATVLSALRPHARNRLIALFGCGGDRDPGKRPLMGEVATHLADRVYVTDDNPRTEPAAFIRRAIIEAAPGAIEIGDRREAIAAAIAELGPGDVLVIAGKGHETGQIIGTEILPFDDTAIAREFAEGSGRLTPWGCSMIPQWSAPDAAAATGGIEYS